MKRLIVTIIAIFTLSTIYSQEGTNAVYDLIERITPGYSGQYTLELLPLIEGEEELFEIDYRDEKVVLRGSTPIALSTAFNWYLKYSCNAQISWFGDQLNLPATLPVPKKERRTINGEYRANFNYCTLSYAAAWWDWERWQREIDFMAMNSINMPLQSVGLDAVWYHTLLDMGLTDSQARAFLVTPAHQAWQWMPNIESIGGSLPLSWIESHKELAKKIYKRELELGMKPIQQAFTGYVPKVLKEIYPDANIAQQPEWYGFEGVSQLDPLDPLFKKMGAIFMKNQKELFGNYGIYAADPFHESTPPDESESYLNRVGEIIYDVIKESDPDAMVAMQSWSIRKPIVSQFPKDKLIVLCLNGGQHDFWGYNFIAGNLHNFGGRINMHGDLALLASNQYEAAKKETPNAVGSGLFMESIEQNPVYYALAYEMPLHKGEVDLDSWLKKYTNRAYGTESSSANRAWEILSKSAYGKGTNGVEFSSIVAARPALNAKKSGPNAGFNIPYDEQQLYLAQELLLKDAEILKESPIYRFDVLDLQRQIMTNLAQKINRAASEAYISGDMKKFKLHSNRFLDLLLDMDKMLSSRGEWNFDRWISSARRWGTNNKERDQLESDATSLVTYWGFSQGYECQQFDYSWREWAGLIRRYYHKRWSIFYDYITQCAKDGKPYSDDGVKLNHGREAFRGSEFYSKLADWEIEFSATAKSDIDPVTKGDELKLVKQMFSKYSKLNSIYRSDKKGVSSNSDNNHSY